MKREHETLREKLIKSCKEHVVGGGRLSFFKQSAELMEFANCTPADLSCSSDELDTFDILSLALADLHYRLQKENVAFRPEVNFYGVLADVKVVRDECESDLELSSEKLSKIQLDPNKTEEDHQQIGSHLRGYFEDLEENDVSDESWGLKIETLKMYAGLPVSSDEAVLSGNELGVLELVLEIAERIYLLKANQAQAMQSKSVETNTDGLMILSPQGQRVVNPFLENGNQTTRDVETTSHRRTVSQ